MSYKVPYAGNQTKLTFVSPYAADRVGIFVPPTRAGFGPGTFARGQEQGFNVYMLQSVAANTPVHRFAFRNGASAPACSGSELAGDDSQDPSVNSRADSGEAPPTATATTLPARLDSLKWTIAAGFAAIFALGLVFLLRRPELAAGYRRRDAMPTPARAKSAARSKPPKPSAEVNRERSRQPRRTEGKLIQARTAPPGRHHRRRRLRPRARPHTEAPARSGKRLSAHALSATGTHSCFQPSILRHTLRQR